MGPTNATIAAALERIATLLEREGREPTSVAGYRHAGRAVVRSPRSAVELVEEGGVEALHELGIGYLIAGHIADWVRYGTSALVQHYEQRQTLELQRVPGIGPKLALEVRQLGIESVEDLAAAARNGQLNRICGFGPKRIAAIRALCRAREDAAPEQLSLIAAEGGEG